MPNYIQLNTGKTPEETIREYLENVAPGASDIVMEQMNLTTTALRRRASALKAATEERQIELQTAYLTECCADIDAIDEQQAPSSGLTAEQKIVEFAQQLDYAGSDKQLQAFFREYERWEKDEEDFRPSEPLKSYAHFLDVDFKNSSWKLRRKQNTQTIRQFLLFTALCKAKAYVNRLADGGPALGILTLDRPNLLAEAQLHFVDQTKTAMDQRVKTIVGNEKNDESSILSNRIEELELAFDPESRWGVVKNSLGNLRVGISDKFGSQLMPRGITKHGRKFDAALSEVVESYAEAFVDCVSLCNNNRVLVLLSGSGHTGMSNWSPRGFEGLIRVGQNSHRGTSWSQWDTKKSLFGISRPTRFKGDDFYIELDPDDIVANRKDGLVRGITLGYVTAHDGQKTLALAVDGPLGIGGLNGGQPTIDEMAYMAFATLQRLLEADIITPGHLTQLNITGFSRGGIATRVFSQLAQAVWPGSHQNILAFDPVSGGGWTMARPIDDNYAVSGNGRQVTVIDVHGGATAPATEEGFFGLKDKLSNTSRIFFPVSLPESETVDIYHGLMNHTGCYVVGGSPEIMQFLACGDMVKVKQEVRQRINDFNCYVMNGYRLTESDNLEAYLQKGLERFVCVDRYTNAFDKDEEGQMRMCMTPRHLFKRDSNGVIIGFKTSLADKADGLTPFTPSNRADMLIDTGLLLGLDDEAIWDIQVGLFEHPEDVQVFQDLAESFHELLEQIDDQEGSQKQWQEKLIALENQIDPLSQLCHEEQDLMFALENFLEHKFASDSTAFTKAFVGKLKLGFGSTAGLLSAKTPLSGLNTFVQTFITSGYADMPLEYIGDDPELARFITDVERLQSLKESIKMTKIKH